MFVINAVQSHRKCRLNVFDVSDVTNVKGGRICVVLMLSV